MANLSVPDFSLPATGDKEINLNNYAGKYLVLYFYPKDNTPGCSIEGKGFRDHYDDFQKLNTEIIGVSRDKIASHDKFKCKLQMPFDLIADTDSKLCKHFNVLGEKNFFGKIIHGIIRSTFLIGPDGKVIKEWRKVKVRNHVSDVLESIRNLA